MVKENLVSAIITFFFSLLLWLIQYLSQRKAKIVYYLGGMNDFVLKSKEQGKPDVRIYTHSLIITNIGRVAAEKLEIYQNIIPTAFSLTPEIKWTVESNKGDQLKHIINIDYLEPSAQITLSYLYDYPYLPQNFISKIRCKDGEGRQIFVLPTKQFPVLFNYLILFLIIVGAITTIYLLTKHVLLKVLGIF